MKGDESKGFSDWESSGLKVSEVCFSPGDESRYLLFHEKFKSFKKALALKVSFAPWV